MMRVVEMKEMRALNKEMERRNHREGWRRRCGGRDRRGERGKGRF